MKRYLLITLLTSLTAQTALASQNFKLIYECKIVGKSTLSKTVSIFADFSKDIKEGAPSLVILSDDFKTNALEGVITMQGIPTPYIQADVKVDANALRKNDQDLFISMDLSKERKVSAFKKANGKIWLEGSDSSEVKKEENLFCSPRF